MKGKKPAAGAQQEQEDEDQGEEEDEEEEDKEEDGEQEIKSILKHRNSHTERGTFELLIHWAGEKAEEATWEPEEEIQRGAAEMLYDYWSTQGGRARAILESKLPDIYRVFEVLAHERKHRGGFQLLVQWVGYSDKPSDTTWEPEPKLKRIAPGALQEYWESAGGRNSYLVKRRRTRKD